jgi:hypothetical protein
MADELDTSLAYEVLRDPESWIGVPSVSMLWTFLQGVVWRANCTGSDIDESLIFGVLQDPEFCSGMTEGAPDSSVSVWRVWIESSHFSLAEGFAHFREAAFDWHAQNGVVTERTWITKHANQSCDSRKAAIKFWPQFLDRPAMYMSSNSGWALFCFLTGMTRGGDWLNIEPMPGAQPLLRLLSEGSMKVFGSAFGLFRYSDNARRLVDEINPETLLNS